MVSRTRPIEMREKRRRSVRSGTGQGTGRRRGRGRRNVTRSGRWIETESGLKRRRGRGRRKCLRSSRDCLVRLTHFAVRRLDVDPTRRAGRFPVRHFLGRLVPSIGGLRQGFVERGERQGGGQGAEARVQVRPDLSASYMRVHPGEGRGGEPHTQLSAARLWAIMLRNCSLSFVKQCTSRKFLDTLEEVLKSKSTTPVVRERLVAVLAAASYASDSGAPTSIFLLSCVPTPVLDSGFRHLWRKVKREDQPEDVCVVPHVPYPC